MIKISLKLDVSFSIIILGIVGLSAMASAVFYLSYSNKQLSEGVTLNKSSKNVNKTGQLISQSKKKIPLKF